MNSKKKAYVYAFITIVFWSTLSTVSKLLLGAMDMNLVLGISSTIAMIILVIYNLVMGNLKNLKGCTIREIGNMCMLGFVGFFLYNAFYLLGIKRLPVQQATILNYLWPAVIIVMSCLFLHEQVTWRKIVAVVLSLIGVSVVAINGDISVMMKSNLGGIIYCVIAAVCYGTYATFNKKQTFPKDIAMMIEFGIVAVIAVLFSVITGSMGEITRFSTATWLGLLYNGICINAIGYTSWMYALEYGETAIISNIAYLIPILSIGVAHIVLGEVISIYVMIGLILILGGICLQIQGNNRSLKKN